MHLRGDIKYNSWRDFWQQAHSAPDFRAVYDTESEKTDWSLSERQLFTQSNGRMLLGQDTMGRLHFACTPHDRIYAVPSGGTDLGGQFKGHIGQYYQNDTALLLGKMQYEAELDSGLLLSAANSSSMTEYRDYFLPVTETRYKECTFRVFSFAPVMEKESLPLSAIHPLPGPAAAMFCVEMTNTAGCTVKGKMRLSFEQKFVSQFEHYGKRFEDYTQRPYRSEWDQKLLVLWHPQACAAIQMLGAAAEGEADNPRIYVPFTLKAGESRVFTTILALTPERSEIHRNLGILYQHTPLEWINVTSSFWKERLGTVNSEIREKKGWGQKYSDMHVRFILDNFNCLSFNENGRLLTNWQGAPSHSLSRLWGIDIEPDVVSVMYAVPEVGPAAVEYLLERNRPRYSLYSDHSIFFYVAPLLIAGKYLELTGDDGYFKTHPQVMEGLANVYQGLLSHKHQEKALFSSHYASDLIVFKKYDYGANVQCYGALKAYCELCGAAGRTAGEARALLERMPADMAECMETDGPFGRQISGGNNLGEDAEKFYIQDELWYYGGEDTATVLAPLYGLYDFNYGPYVNLHWFAKSLFLMNYDPEFQTMRELHFGMNPSATGCTLRLGGSFTRKEMLETLKILYDRLDETGSLFWWPRAYNKKRCLTRCSQGQGAWVQQSVEQWYGLRLNGRKRELTIRPQGLLSEYQMENIRLGTFRFDISYKETEDRTEYIVTNRNEESFTLQLYARPYGAGAELCEKKEAMTVPAGGTVQRSYKMQLCQSKEPEIEKMECGLLGEDGVIFSPYGIVMPKLSFAAGCSIFLLRFVIVHDGEKVWEDAEVSLKLPKGWEAAEKKFYMWDYQPVFSEGSEALCSVGRISPYRHAVAGFYVALPDELSGDEKSVMLSAHPYTQDGRRKKDVCLYVKGNKEQELAAISAVLNVNGEEKAHYVLPVKILDEKNYDTKFELMYHGK